ncbi:MAG: insulinase family protein [bacterium]|nr:insulinase family protein [bacterium]
MRFFIVTTLFLSIFFFPLFSIGNDHDVVPPYTPTEVLKTTPVVLPPYTTHTLKNGLKVFLIQQNKIPTIAFRLIVLNGAFQDPKGKEGITQFAAELLRKGVKLNQQEINSIRFSEMIDSVGAVLGAGTDFNELYVSAFGLSKHSDLMLSLLSAMVIHPTFPENEIQRLKFQKYASFRAKRDEPEQIAREVFYRQLYGNHRYGFPLEGDSISVSSIQRNDLVEHWSKLALPNSSLLAVVGDFDTSQMLQKLNQYFGTWRSGPLLPKPDDPTPTESNELRIFFVNKEDAVQTNIRIGHHGIKRNHPDYHIVEVLETILMGGDFDSKLMKILRSDRGLTYGIGGRFVAETFAGPVSIGTFTRNEKTKEMVEGIIEIVKEFIRSGPTDDELMQAKMYLTGNYPLQFETPNDIASHILDLEIYKLSPKTIPEYRSKIAKVTKGDVMRVAGELLNPDKFILVCVGKKSEVHKQLLFLGKTNTKIINVEY